MSEHDFEPIRGLPGNLPAGEIILWQGAPSWRVLAGQAFHIRAVAAYFGIMLIWRVVSAVVGGDTPLHAVTSVAAVTPIAFAALGILAFMAWLNSRTTVYTITNRRVVLRFGAAVPKAINIPFAIIDAAAVKSLGGGAGDLALTLKAPNKIAFLQLWPHARPWRLARPQPTLRALAEVDGAASILADAINSIVAVEAAQPAPVRRPLRPVSGLAGSEPVAA